MATLSWEEMSGGGAGEVETKTPAKAPKGTLSWEAMTGQTDFEVDASRKPDVGESLVRGVNAMGKELVPVADMILGFPAFIAKTGLTGILGTTEAVSDLVTGRQNGRPLQRAANTINKAMETPLGRTLASPIQELITGYPDAEETVVGRVMEGQTKAVDRAAEYWAEKTGRPELGDALKQAVDTGILTLPNATRAVSNWWKGKKPGDKSAIPPELTAGPAGLEPGVNYDLPPSMRPKPVVPEKVKVNYKDFMASQKKLTPEEAIAASDKRIKEIETELARRAAAGPQTPEQVAAGLFVEETPGKPRVKYADYIAGLEASADKAAMKVVDAKGEPLKTGMGEGGQVDPRLLGALGVASTAAWLAMDPEKQNDLATLGVIGATGMAGHGKGSPLGVLREKIPYVIKTLELLPKGSVEIGRQQITDLLRKPELAAERPVIEWVLETLPPGKTVNAFDLVNGVVEETASWKLEPKETGQYAGYGIELINRSSAEAYPYGGVPSGLKVVEPTTTLYRLPEHMQMSDANHFGDERLFGWTRSFQEDGVKHVVEIQSDLAQHAKELSTETREKHLAQLQVSTDNVAYLKQKLRDAANGKIDESAGSINRELLREQLKVEESSAALNSMAVSSQLSPILKHWPRRLIREELLKSAKKQAAAKQLGDYYQGMAGGESAAYNADMLGEAARVKQAEQNASSVRFATADTVAKVEGWPGIRIHPIEGESFLQPGKFADPGHQSIYNRYAGEITRYLKGLGGKEVTDAQGHTWIEVPTKSVLVGEGSPRIAMLGKADPKLLAAIAAAAGAGIYLAGEHSDEDKMTALGIGAVAVGSRKALRGANEATLLAAMKEGGAMRDAAAAELFRQHNSQAIRMARRFGAKDLAEDVTQRAWEKVLSSIDRGLFRGESEFATYLTTAVRNETINRFRHEAARPTISIEEGKVLGEEGESRGGIEATLGHEDTPEKAQVNAQLGEAISRALEKVDPNMRESFLMSVVEGMPSAEIAAKRGIPDATVRTQIHRVREDLQRILKNERGIVNLGMGIDVVQWAKDHPELMGVARLAGTAAAVGALLDTNDRLQGAVLGALGMFAFEAAMKTSMGKGLDYTLGLVSTRLPPALRLRAREFERVQMERTDKALDTIDPFIRGLHKMPKAEKAALNQALLENDATQIAGMLQGKPEMMTAWTAVRDLLEKFRLEQVALGRYQAGLTEYFPRIVKDLKGLTEELGIAQRTHLETTLALAERQMMLKQKRGLTDVERSIIVNRSLVATGSSARLPAHAKARGVKDLTADLGKFYETPTDALLRYVSAAVQDAEVAKFFGKHLKATKKGSKLATNVDDSVGSLVDEEIAAGRMTYEQANEVREILKARFEAGEKPMNGLLQDVRNATNIGLLGSFHSAATQIGDSVMTAYHHGLLPTLEGIRQQLTGSAKISTKEFGLTNHIAEELGSARLSGKALQYVFKGTLFSWIDQFAKKVNLAAGLEKNQRLASNPKGEAFLHEKYASAFGTEMPALLADLKSGQITPRVKSLLFSELSDAQPVTKMEMPQAYLEHPNGRLLYQMKSYMLKQFDVIRRDAYQEIKSGNYVRGAKNLVAVAAALSLSNIPGDIVKDWLSGRKIDLTKIDYVENLLQNFGLNRYSLDKINAKTGQGLQDFALGTVTPPMLKMGAQAIDKPATLTKYIPGVGRAIYDRNLGGNEARKAVEIMREKITKRNEDEAKYPWKRKARLKEAAQKREEQMKKLRSQL